MEYVCLVLVFIGIFMFVLFTHQVQQNTLKLKQTYADSLDLYVLTPPILHIMNKRSKQDGNMQRLRVIINP